MNSALGCLGGLALAGAVCLALSATPDQPPAAAVAATPPDLAAREVSFQSADGLVLHGSVLEPAGATAPKPGLVLLHGSGPASQRTRFLEEASAFARQGLAVLIYDKRPDSTTGGRRSYTRLADDALAAVRTLRAQPGVDPAKVGIWGLSEGGWVAPLAAAGAPEVAFVIVVGANAMPPVRQQTWAVVSALRRAGVTGALVGRATPTMYRLLADAGLFPEAYHDAEAVLRRVRQPLLGIWGYDDLLTPPEENPPLFARALQQGGNPHYTLRFFPGAGHAARQSLDGGKTQLPALAPGYAELVGAWVGSVTSGSLPSADAPAPPRQAWPSTPVPASAQTAAAALQLGAFALLAAAFGSYPLIALVRRVRGQTAPAAVGGPARLLAGAGMAALLGLPAYLLPLLMIRAAATAPGPLLAGRPPLWLLLQALALLAAGATLATAAAWRRSELPLPRGERLRLGLLLVGGAVFVPWAVHWGLLLP